MRRMWVRPGYVLLVLCLSLPANRAAADPDLECPPGQPEFHLDPTQTTPVLVTCPAGDRPYYIRLLDKLNYPVVGQSVFLRLLHDDCVYDAAGSMRSSYTNVNCFNSNNCLHCPSCYGGLCFPSDRWATATTNGNGVARIDLFAGGVCPPDYTPTSFAIRVPSSAPCATFSGCGGEVRQTSFDLVNSSGQPIGDCTVGIADEVYFTNSYGCGEPCDFDGDGVPTGLGDCVLLTPHLVEGHVCQWSAFKPAEGAARDVELTAEATVEGVLVRLDVRAAARGSRFRVWRFAHDFTEYGVVAEIPAAAGPYFRQEVLDVETTKSASHVYLVEEILDDGERIDHGGATVGPFYGSAEFRSMAEPAGRPSPPAVRRVSWGQLRSRY